MSPELALNIVALHDEYEVKGDSRRATAELDSLVIQTMNGLIETGRYPATICGDALLVKDAHRFICNTCPTLTNAEVASSLLRWQVINDVLAHY